MSEGKVAAIKCGFAVDEYSPRIQAVPPQRFERHETFDSSVSKGATRRVSTQDASFDDEPGADEYGYSLVECWVAEVGRTHL